ADKLAKGLPRRTVDSFAVLPVLRMALEAVKGTTDFGVLFASMSMFLVMAAMGLSGALMRLMAERRAAEAGMLLACGFTERNVLHAIIGEGSVLAILGAGAGCGLGVLYANAIVSLLASGAIGTIGNARLHLHVQTGSLVLGSIIGAGAGFASTWWGVRKLVRHRVLDLLAGWRALGTGGRSARFPVAAVVGAVAAVMAVALIGLGLAAAISPTAVFFGGGFALLAAAMCACYLVLARAMRRPMGRVSLGRLVVRSAAANRLRSMLAVGLFACAAFVIIAAAANRRDYSQIDIHDKTSGTGGFALRATSSLPIRYDFGTATGREKLGFPPEDQALFDAVNVYSFLASPGDDISCLNLAKAGMPRIIGASNAFIERGGFGLQGMAAKDAEGRPACRSRAAGRPLRASWSSLREREWCGGRIPVVGDAGSVQWSLHSAPGKTLALPIGGDRGLCVAGVIPNSIFAGELVMSDRCFRQIFPSETDPRYFLIETPPGREDAVADALRRNLGDAGLEVRNTGEILNSIISVQNTYLSTFTALGGLGVALGTFGLAAVLLRSALERRGEFALMLATGFSRVHLVWLLVLENAGLLAVGLLAGSAAALVAVVPQLRSAEASVNWLLLAALPVAIMALGLLVCTAAAAAMLRGNLVEALREE
ncbi:MAG TPA: FtsX-like permease family protein, partial [Planctomycetota bacterium]|nr:FtsX-like permease family protein [Planctomycetota bacterium]